MASGMKNFHKERKRFLSAIVSLPRWDFDKIDWVVSLRGKNSEFVIKLKPPRLNPGYAKSSFGSLLDYYTRGAGIENNFCFYYSEPDNTMHVAKSKDSKQIAFLAALFGYLSYGRRPSREPKGEQNNADKTYRDFTFKTKKELDKYKGLEKEYKQELGNIKFGYEIRWLNLRLKEASLDILLREEKDLNFNKNDIESSFRLGLENCLKKVNLNYDFTVEYERISQVVHTQLYAVNTKTKAFLSAVYSMLEKQVAK